MSADRPILPANIEQYVCSSKFSETRSPLIFRNKNECLQPEVSKITILVVTGTPGGGKDTFVKELMEQSSWFGRPKTVTTRTEIRKEEEENDPYIRYSQTMFEVAKNCGLFIETNEHAGNWYGSLKSEVAEIVKERKIPVLRIDPNGARNVKNTLAPYKSVRIISTFIIPPNPFEIYMRLFSREIKNKKTPTEARARTQKRMVNSVLSDITHIGEASYILINPAKKIDQLVRDFLEELRSPCSQETNLS